MPKLRMTIIAGNARSLVANRGDLIGELERRGVEVVALVPSADIAPFRDQIPVPYHEIPLVRGGLDPFVDLQALWAIWRHLRAERPDAVLAYTIKPVVYGTLAARLAGCSRVFAMITGLGYAFTGDGAGRGLARTAASRLYRLAMRLCTRVFFQNPDDRSAFLDLGMLRDPRKIVMIAGSGINLERFPATPAMRAPLTFLVIARLLGDKGVREFVEAARMLHGRHPGIRFVHLGSHEPHLRDALPVGEIEAWKREGKVSFEGFQHDVRPFITAASVYVLPSYREGTPRSVLEAMAMGRPIITTDAPGCRETVVDGVNGFLVPVGDAKGLAGAMARFVREPDLIETMGRESRRLAEERFDVRKVNEVIIGAMLQDEARHPAGKTRESG